MDTRQKIILTARRLFNEKGLENTSARSIATAMDISDGNLRYYFRTKEDLIYALYMDLVETFDIKFEDYELKSEFSLEEVFNSIYSVYTQLYEHRYLMTDFMTIMRKYSDIREHYKGLMKIRKRQFIHVIEALKKSEILTNEYASEHYERMIEQFYVFSDAWIGQAEIFLNDAKGEEKIKYYSQLAFGMLVPFLTERGWKLYSQVLMKYD